ncbi:MAG: ribosome silencing factor [Planctomycetota bacterium]|nr:ribosome silencing factor [Planctomycetota bacterium]
MADGRTKKTGAARARATSQKSGATTGARKKTGKKPAAPGPTSRPTKKKVGGAARPAPKPKAAPAARGSAASGKASDTTAPNKKAPNKKAPAKRPAKSGATTPAKPRARKASARDAARAAERLEHDAPELDGPELTGPELDGPTLTGADSDAPDLQALNLDAPDRPLPARVASGADPAAAGAGDSAREFAIETARLLHDDKCTEIVVLDVRSASPVTDYIVIGSGTSDRQMRSVLKHAEDLGAARGYRAWRSDADQGGRWLLMDCVDVVVHLFEPNTRSHYDLEMLWGDAPRVEWERPDQMPRDRAGLRVRARETA